MKTTVAAIDFGTSKIVALVAETSGRQRCDIIGAGTTVYDGYLEGRWNAPDQLNDAISDAVHAAEEQSHTRIRDVFVGVPGDFSQVRTVEVKVELQGADPRVTEKNISDLFDRAVDELGEVRGSIIHRSPAWFIVDDGKKTLEPMGMRGYELRAMISFVIADQFFLEDIQERFRSLGITVSGCLSTPIGQAMLFVPDEERDRSAVLVDVGYLTTEVMTVQGDAITSLTNIPMGGGHIAADLAYGLEVTLPVAEQIKRAYVYGLSAGQSTFEGTDQAGNAKTFTREQVEEVLEPRAEEICEAIRDAIRDSGAKLGKWSPVYLTGGGLAINRGGREYLAAKLERTVRELPRKAVKLSSPAYSSALGLLDLLIDTTTSARASGGMGGFFRSLFGG
ncbi:MAG: cell division FtsA domain-containing protein [Clostridia bacterium]|nr:cell division FtsA domain-containing protein [Clostridia bacterium]